DRRAAVLERDAAAAALGARRLPRAVVRPRTSRDVVRGIAVSDRGGVDPNPHPRTASSFRAGAARDALRTPRGRSADRRRDGGTARRPERLGSNSWILTQLTGARGRG